MILTAVGNNFDDTKQQCEEWLGRIPFFIMMDNYHTRNQRLGQAFMNSASHEDRVKLIGTDADPFERDDWEAIQRAIDFLLEN